MNSSTMSVRRDSRQSDLQNGLPIKAIFQAADLSGYRFGCIGTPVQPTPELLELFERAYVLSDQSQQTTIHAKKAVHEALATLGTLGIYLTQQPRVEQSLPPASSVNKIRICTSISEALFQPELSERGPTSTTTLAKLWTSILHGRYWGTVVLACLATTVVASFAIAISGPTPQRARTEMPGAVLISELPAAPHNQNSN